ncbi:MAG TPA: hypothetical protein VIW67_08990 [Terriglobales bacterium]|jgi:hypothetical protein
MPPSPSEVWACWAEDFQTADSFPPLVIVGDDDLIDFLAWAVTFLPTFRPLTSFLRVLPWTIYSLASEQRYMPETEIGSILLGAILGETLTNATGRGFVESLPLTAFESTHSYAMSRVLALGLNAKLAPYVSNGWQLTRALTEHRTRQLPHHALEKVWSLLVSLASRPNNAPPTVVDDDQLRVIWDACAEIRSGGRLSGLIWDQLSRGRLSNSTLDEFIEAPKERRVEVFEMAVRSLSLMPSEELSTSFLLGYLANLVSGGSLEHAHLIFPLQHQLPTAMLWYGICAGLAPHSRILADYGHLGIKLLRSLNRHEDLMSPPSSDISLSELEVILRDPPRTRAFRQAHTSSLRVELAPFVNTVMRSIATRPTNDQPNLIEDDAIQEPSDRVRLSELIISLRRTLSMAESLLDSTPKHPDGPAPQSKGKRRH